MACFIAPAAAAIITTSIKKKIPSQYHLEWLNLMLWGGVIMLIVDHIISGEVIFYPPFLSAMKNPADTAVMLKEIATTGTVMTLAIIVMWAVIVMIANQKIKINTRKI